MTDTATSEAGTTDRRSGVLVTTDWMDRRLEAPDVRLVEVDEDPTLYDRGHIPGAVCWDWREDLHHPTRRDYRDREAVRALLERSGVDGGTTVVLYSSRSNWFAAYAYWLLRYRGFDRACLLDGGRTRWEWEGRPLETVASSPDRGRLGELGPERPELRALRDDVLEAVRGEADPDPLFVDVREPGEFRGELLAPPHLPQEGSYVAGHIPGAVNIPWSRAVGEDGTFRPEEDLREVYADVLSGERVVVYCRIGDRAAHTWFVLHELLGHEDVANYDGSWTEYGSLVGVPVER